MEEKKTGKKSLLKIAKVVFLILVAVFLVNFFYRNYDDYKNLDVRINWGVFAFSILLYFAYKVTLASLWHYITIQNRCAIRYTRALSAYLYSILGKYIPGKVFMLLARVPAYKEAGVQARRVTVCFFLENVCTLLGAAFLFLISLFFFPNELLNDYKWVTIGLIVLFFLCINPKIINFFLNYVEKFTKMKDLRLTVSYAQMIRIVILFILNWIVVGVGFYMLACSIYPLPMSEFLYVAGIYGLSCIIGILAVFSPSGIGVREGIMLVGLGLVMPEEYAMIISIVSRLWQTVAELILIGIVLLINKGSAAIKKSGDQKKR